jgi:hypothetical protein
MEWLANYCEEAGIELVLLKPSSRAELHRNLTANKGVGSTGQFSLLFNVCLD